VTLVELASQILPVEDAEVSAAVRKSFEKRGIQVHTQTLVTQVQLTDTGVRCTMKNTAPNLSWKSNVCCWRLAYSRILKIWGWKHWASS
jgi:pyruvate/2-oxoglutarate dehydrogenase complex dihydrolipoamide dehydrogenase (E3) component